MRSPATPRLASSVISGTFARRPRGICPGAYVGHLPPAVVAMDTGVGERKGWSGVDVGLSDGRGRRENWSRGGRFRGNCGENWCVAGSGGVGDDAESERQLPFQEELPFRSRGFGTLDADELHLRSRASPRRFRCLPSPARLRCAASLSIASAIDWLVHRQEALWRCSSELGGSSENDPAPLLVV